MLLSEVDFKTEKDPLAEGGAGLIFMGTLTSPAALKRSHGEKMCIIKVMKDVEGNSDDAMALFQQEVSIIWLLHECKNIITIYGYCPQPAMIVMKFYPDGSLEDLIHKNKDTQIIPDNQWTPKFILRTMNDIANGLLFMHDFGLVHNDLKVFFTHHDANVKPGNVLLEKQPNGTLLCCLCDFGVTSIIDSNLLRVKAYKKSNVKGASLVYAAPEQLRAFAESEEDRDNTLPAAEAIAGDIYAFSMVIYELLYRRIPWWDVDDLEDIVKRVVGGQRPKLPAALLNRRANDPYVGAIMDIMESCWSNNPLKRPKMAQVLSKITETLGLKK